MKNLIWLLAGVAAAVAYVVVSKGPQAARGPIPPVDDLAHKLQDAWVDHHTVV